MDIFDDRLEHPGSIIEVRYLDIHLKCIVFMKKWFIQAMIFTQLLMLFFQHISINHSYL